MARIPDCARRVLLRQEWFPDPAALGKARLWVIDLPNFIRRLPAAITIGDNIIFPRREYFSPIDPSGLSVLAHELWHVQQYHSEGRIKFSLKYLREWLPLMIKRKNIYQHLSYEVEATALQTHVEKALRQEFALNGGQGPCRKEGARIEENPSYQVHFIEPFSSEK